MIVKKKKRETHEEKLQKNQIKVLRQIRSYTGKLTFTHVPNELQRSSNVRKIYWHLGCESGVPDLILFLYGGKTIFIENKWGPNKIKDGDNQDLWCCTARLLGFDVYEIRVSDIASGVNALLEILRVHGIDDTRLKHQPKVDTEWRQVYPGIRGVFIK